MEKIYVTKSFLPPIDEYNSYIKRIFASHQLTNQGSLLLELEDKLKSFLDVPYFHYVTNGTVAIQLALRALRITEGEVITTPFSYVATTGSILWERCKPVFVDIDRDTFCIDPEKIEEAITHDTKAILAVHVFGYPCDVDKIDIIAQKYNLKVIYDAAHSFGAKYKGKALSAYGDAATLSFHATKLFHTAEGGGIVVCDKSVDAKVDVMKRFGHNMDDHYCTGINAKASELHAAMGLANFPYIQSIIAERRRLSGLYDGFLGGFVLRPSAPDALEYNYAYYPVLFKDEGELIAVKEALEAEGIIPRRYFYPSLNTLPYLDDAEKCRVSEDISSRILCLPLYVGLTEGVIERISNVIRQNT